MFVEIETSNGGSYEPGRAMTLQGAPPDIGRMMRDGIRSACMTIRRAGAAEFPGTHSSARMKTLAGKKLLARGLATGISNRHGVGHRVPVDSGPDQSVTPASSCVHRPKRAALDSSMWCIKCGSYLGEAN